MAGSGRDFTASGFERYSVSVAGAVFDDNGRVLAIRRRDNGRWELPGGKLEPGETLAAGAAREVLEETGVTVAPEVLTGVYQNMVRGVVAFVFRCRPTAGVATVSDEAAEVAWLTLAEVSERMVEAYAVRLLDAAGDLDRPPEVRYHDGVSLLVDGPRMRRADGDGGDDDGPGFEVVREVERGGGGAVRSTPTPPAPTRAEAYKALRNQYEQMEPGSQAQVEVERRLRAARLALREEQRRGGRRTLANSLDPPPHHVGGSGVDRGHGVER